MESDDYKERFKAKYYQAKIRKEKLQKILDDWEYLSFIPNSPKRYLKYQRDVMLEYMQVLKKGRKRRY